MGRSQIVFLLHLQAPRMRAGPACSCSQPWCRSSAPPQPARSACPGTTTRGAGPPWRERSCRWAAALVFKGSILGGRVREGPRDVPLSIGKEGMEEGGGGWVGGVPPLRERAFQGRGAVRLHPCPAARVRGFDAGLVGGTGDDPAAPATLRSHGSSPPTSIGMRVVSITASTTSIELTSSTTPYQIRAACSWLGGSPMAAPQRDNFESSSVW